MSIETEKFVAKLGLVLRKIETEDKMKYDKFYSQSQVETIINPLNTDAFSKLM